MRTQTFILYVLEPLCLVGLSLPVSEHFSNNEVHPYGFQGCSLLGKLVTMLVTETVSLVISLSQKGWHSICVTY